MLIGYYSLLTVVTVIGCPYLIDRLIEDREHHIFEGSTMGPRLPGLKGNYFSLIGLAIALLVAMTPAGSFGALRGLDFPSLPLLGPGLAVVSGALVFHLFSLRSLNAFMKRYDEIVVDSHVGALQKERGRIIGIQNVTGRLILQVALGLFAVGQFVLL